MLSSDGIRGVLLDAAGTLIRLRSPVGAAYGNWARSAGCPASERRLEWAFQHAFAALSSRRRVSGSCRAAEPSDAWWREVVDLTFRLAGEVPPAAPFGELLESFSGGAAWELFPRVRETLGALSTAGFRLGVLSNFDERLESVLAGCGVLDRFHAVVVSSRLGMEKPCPEIFRAAARALDLPPVAVLHVGDSYSEDLLGGRSAGMRTLLVDREDRYPIAERVTDLAGLPALLAGRERDRAPF